MKVCNLISDAFVICQVILNVPLLPRSPSYLYNLFAMEMKLTSTNFSRRVTEGSRSTWLQTLGFKLLIVPHTLGILTANITYCIMLLEHVNESQVNAHIVNLGPGKSVRTIEVTH